MFRNYLYLTQNSEKYVTVKNNKLAKFLAKWHPEDTNINVESEQPDDDIRMYVTRYLNEM